MTEEKVEKELIIPMSIKVVFVIITVIFFATVLGFSWLVTDVQNISRKNTVLVAKNDILTKENQARITDIQNSRVEGCKNIYEGIRKVFKPFFPPAPRSPNQQANLDKFNTTIISLQLECTRIIKSK